MLISTDEIMPFIQYRHPSSVFETNNSSLVSWKLVFLVPGDFTDDSLSCL